MICKITTTILKSYDNHVTFRIAEINNNFSNTLPFVYKKLSHTSHFRNFKLIIAIYRDGILNILEY